MPRRRMRTGGRTRRCSSSKEPLSTQWTVRLPPADLPKGLAHRFEVISEEAHFLVIITPGGFEELFAEVSPPAASARLPDADDHAHTDPAAIRTTGLPEADEQRLARCLAPVPAARRNTDRLHLPAGRTPHLPPLPATARADVRRACVPCGRTGVLVGQRRPRGHRPPLARRHASSHRTKRGMNAMARVPCGWRTARTVSATCGHGRTRGRDPRSVRAGPSGGSC